MFLIRGENGYCRSRELYTNDEAFELPFVEVQREQLPSNTKTPVYHYRCSCGLFNVVRYCRTFRDAKIFADYVYKMVVIGVQGGIYKYMSRDKEEIKGA